MSRIYFHAPSAEAELHGSERAYLGGLVEDIYLGLLDLDHPVADERLTPLINPNHYAAQQRQTGDPFVDHQRWRITMRTALGIHGEGALAWRGKPIDTFRLALNTALAVGNDQIKLAAILYGQCEIHCWVNGPNRAWLADLMQVGIDTGIYRRTLTHKRTPDGPDVFTDQGWDGVIALLRARDDEPVVCSYSVTDSFPSRNVTNWTPPGWDDMDDDERENDESWYELPDNEQWRLALAGLKAGRAGVGNELSPDMWADFHFGDGLTVFDLYASDREARLDAALLDENDEARV